MSRHVRGLAEFAAPAPASIVCSSGFAPLAMQPLFLLRSSWSRSRPPAIPLGGSQRTPLGASGTLWVHESLRLAREVADAGERAEEVRGPLVDQAPAGVLGVDGHLADRVDRHSARGFALAATAATNSTGS